MARVQSNEQLQIREQLRDTERWFVRQGAPHFIDKYGAFEDVFTRSSRLFVAIFVLETFAVADLDWPWWLNGLAIIAAIAIAVGSIVGLNKLRDRPRFARPERVGPLELLGFVIVPSLLPLIIGGRGSVAVQFLAFNAAFVLAVYVVVGLGALAMISWGLRHLRKQIGELFDLAVRTLPLLLIFSAFLFINAEIWSVAANTPPLFFFGATSLLLLIELSFTIFRVGSDLHELEQFDSWHEIATFHEKQTDLEIAVPVDETYEPTVLRRFERWNMKLLMGVAQSLQVLLTAAAIGFFYVVFGVLLVGQSTIEIWIGHELVAADILATLSIGDNQLVLTWPLIRTAIFIASFSALHFGVSALTDEQYRKEFRADQLESVKGLMAVRALYLWRLRRIDSADV